MRHNHYGIDYGFAQRRTFHQAFWRMVFTLRLPSHNQVVTSCR